MTTLDRINALLKNVGGSPIEPGSTRHHSLHAELDHIDRQLGLITTRGYSRPSSCGTRLDRQSLIGERVRRLEHAVTQARVARLFNGTPDYFHLGFEAEAA